MLNQNFNSLQKTEDILYRPALVRDSRKLSILFKQVYIQTYGTEGVSDEFANFIILQFSVERIERILLENPDSLMVAVYKNNLVGVAEVAFSKQCPIDPIIGAELNKLYILEWFCGSGIGQRLLELAEEVAVKRGEEQMWLWVLASNTRAINFYEKHQYKWIGNASFQMETNKYENKVMLKDLVVR